MPEDKGHSKRDDKVQFWRWRRHFLLVRVPVATAVPMSAARVEGGNRGTARRRKTLHEKLVQLEDLGIKHDFSEVANDM